MKEKREKAKMNPIDIGKPQIRKSFHEQLNETPFSHNDPTRQYGKQIIVIASVSTIVYLLVAFGVGLYPFTRPPTGGVTSACVAAANAAPALVSYAVKNAITGAPLSASTTTVDIVTNPASLNSYTETESSPTISTFKYNACQTLWFHAYSTAGNGYYDAWQQVVLPGFTSSCASNQQCYDITTSQPILLYQRTTTANAAIGVGSCTGSATFARSTALSTTSAGSSTGTADCSPGSGVRTVNFIISLNLAAASTCLGVPTPYLNPITAGVQTTLGLGIWMSINSTTPPTVTSTGATFLTSSVAQPTSTTKWTTWFASLPTPICTSPGLVTTGTTSITVTLQYTTTVGNRIMLWTQDQQTAAIVASGSTANPPVNVGAFSGAGTTTTIVVNANSYQLSSGIPSAPVLAFTINIT